MYFLPPPGFRTVQRPWEGSKAHQIFPEFGEFVSYKFEVLDCGVYGVWLVKCSASLGMFPAKFILRLFTQIFPFSRKVQFPFVTGNFSIVVRSKRRRVIYFRVSCNTFSLFDIVILDQFESKMTKLKFNVFVRKFKLSFLFQPKENSSLFWMRSCQGHYISLVFLILR